MSSRGGAAANAEPPKSKALARTTNDTFGKEFRRPSIPRLNLIKNGNFVPRELALELDTHGIEAARQQYRKSASAEIGPRDTRGAEQFQAK